MEVILSLDGSSTLDFSDGERWFDSGTKKVHMIEGKPRL